jgi:hypothetical protein
MGVYSVDGRWGEIITSASALNDMEQMVQVVMSPSREAQGWHGSSWAIMVEANIHVVDDVTVVQASPSVPTSLPEPQAITHTAMVDNLASAVTSASTSAVGGTMSASTTLPAEASTASLVADSLPAPGDQ